MMIIYATAHSTIKPTDATIATKIAATISVAVNAMLSSAI